MRSQQILKRSLPVFALLLPALLLPWSGCAQLAVDQAIDRKVDSLLFWPDGNVHRGMEAFRDLRCYQCHKVKSIPELGAMTEEAIGPALDEETAHRDRVDILVQIVAPGTNPSIQESHMGNFDEVMTVAQLTDLVAFVESLHEQ